MKQKSKKTLLTPVQQADALMQEWYGTDYGAGIKRKKAS